MIAKLVEALFRHKLLILLPPVLIPLIVGPLALLMAPVYYETWAGIWVDRPTYLDYKDSWNSYLTPAQNQSGRLGELMRTRSFLVEVANRTPLAPLTTSPKGEQQLRRFIGNGFAQFPSGSNLLVLRFRAPSPQLSFQVLKAIIDTFNERTATDRVNQASIAIAFYESRLQSAEEELAKANDAIRRYVAANPRLTAIDPDRGAAATTAVRLGLPATAIDPTLGELMRQLELRQQDAERMRASLEQARLDASAALEGQELGFQVVDPPRVPTEATRQRRRALIYPAAGLVVAVGFSVSLLVLLVAADRSVRTEGDLAPAVRVLGVAPRLRLRRVPKGIGPDAARRAIGYVAGASLALPALPAPKGGS